MRRKTENPSRADPHSRQDQREPNRPASQSGLCSSCHWLREQPTQRGAVFYRCARADFDDSYLRYPPIPVRQCPGHEPSRTTPASNPDRTGS